MQKVFWDNPYQQSLTTVGRITDSQIYELNFSKLDGKYVELALFRGIEGIIFLSLHAKELIDRKLAKPLNAIEEICTK